MTRNKRLAAGAGAGVLALAGAMAVLPITYQTRVSPDGLYKVDWIGAWTINPPGFKVEMYSTKLPDGTPVKINRQMPADDDCTLDSFIASDSLSVVYRAGSTAFGHFDLWSVPIKGGVSTKLNQPVAGMVQDGIREVYGKLVRYCADVEIAGGNVTCWIVPIGVGVPRAEVFQDGFNNGNSGAWR